MTFYLKYSLRRPLDCVARSGRYTFPFPLPPICTIAYQLAYRITLCCMELFTVYVLLLLLLLLLLLFTAIELSLGGSSPYTSNK